MYRFAVFVRMKRKVPRSVGLVPKKSKLTHADSCSLVPVAGGANGRVCSSVSSVLQQTLVARSRVSHKDYQKAFKSLDIFDQQRVLCQTIDGDKTMWEDWAAANDALVRHL